jgi:hypothetical protein
MLAIWGIVFVSRDSGNEQQNAASSRALAGEDGPDPTPTPAAAAGAAADDTVVELPDTKSIFAKPSNPTAPRRGPAAALGSLSILGLPPLNLPVLNFPPIFTLPPVTSPPPTTQPPPPDTTQPPPPPPTEPPVEG